ncbi:MAG TPA: hypothetical protein VKT82_33665 [Ktedonobacterales bacterium]|nr:hypothetical protein [Ktedonobacterales bacterium]
MHGNKVPLHLQAVLIFLRRPPIPSTAGEKRFQISFLVVLVLLMLGWIVPLFIGLFTFNDLLFHLGILLLFAALAVVVAGAAAIIVWRSRVVTSAVQARQAAGIPIPAPTTQETAGCITLGSGLALMVLLAVVIVLFVPYPARDWLGMLIPLLAWFPAILCGVLWRRRRRSQRGAA